MSRGFAQDAADLTRVALARATSRLRVARADESYVVDVATAFRDELGTCVRNVSPFVMAVLEDARLPIDELVMLIAPPEGWPFRPAQGHRRVGVERKRVRHDTAHVPSAGRSLTRVAMRDPGVTIGMAAGGRLRIHAHGSSLEATGRIGAVGVSTADGTVRLEVPGDLPATLRAVSIGAPASDLVDLDVLRGRAWRVVDLEAPSAVRGWTFVVSVGMRSYLMPWVRPP